jgi:hypothetical protein
VVRDPGTGRVLKEVPADRAQQSISVGIWKRIDVPAASGPAQTPEAKPQGRPGAKFEFNKESGSAQTPGAKGQGAASGQNQAEP